MCKEVTIEELQTKIERLQVLLLNAIALAEEGTVDTQAEPFEYEDKAEWLEDHLAIFITNKLNKLLLAAALAELEFLKGSAIEVSCVAPSALRALYGILYTAHNVPPIR